MQVPNRYYNGADYRYGFNGKEKDDEVKGNGNSIDFGARMYDPRIGRWFNADPFERFFPYLSTYAAFKNNPIFYIDPDGGSTISAADGPPWFRVGKNLRPKFKYDNGFSDLPKVIPTASDKWKEFGWGVLTGVVESIRWDMGNAIAAYKHFQNGNGNDYKFDLEDYFDDDSSGKQMHDNSVIIAKSSAQDLLKKTGTISMTSIGINVNRSNFRFPYPDSSDWQYAVGAFNFWMSADVSAVDKDGYINYTMKLTLHAEDKYNFNPGDKAIGTGIPDSANGRFEQTGQGTQFMQYGTYKETVTWKVKSETSKPIQVKKDKKQTNNKQATSKEAEMVHKSPRHF